MAAPDRRTGRTQNDDDLAIAYTGSWFASGFRGLGDYNDGVHATSSNGDSATLTFPGTGVSVQTETNTDEGTIAVSVDGVSKGTVNAFSPTPAGAVRSPPADRWPPP